MGRKKSIRKPERCRVGAPPKKEGKGQARKSKQKKGRKGSPPIVSTLKRPYLIVNASKRV